MFIDFLNDEILISDLNEFESMVEDFTEDELDAIMEVICDGIEDDELSEKLSAMGRRKLAASMKRRGAKLQKAKERKQNKMVVSKDDLMVKARKEAVNVLRQKWMKGSEDSLKNKQKFEDRIKKSAKLVDKIAKKKLKDVKKMVMDKKKANKQADKQPKGIDNG